MKVTAAAIREVGESLVMNLALMHEVALLQLKASIAKVTED